MFIDIGVVAPGIEHDIREAVGVGRRHGENGRGKSFSARAGLLPVAVEHSDKCRRNVKYFAGSYAMVQVIDLRIESNDVIGAIVLDIRKRAAVELPRRHHTVVMAVAHGTPGDVVRVRARVHLCRPGRRRDIGFMRLEIGSSGVLPLRYEEIPIRFSIVLELQCQHVRLADVTRRMCQVFVLGAEADEGLAIINVGFKLNFARRRVGRKIDGETNPR